MSGAVRTKRPRKKRSRAYRQPLVRFKGPPTTLEELLDPYRVFVAPNGCWLWLGADDGKDHLANGGYGRVLKPGTRIVEPAHRYVCRVFNGPFPDSYDVDHLCARWIRNPNPRYNRRCVNPDHLEAVPAAENQYRRRMAARGTYGMDYEPEDCDPPAERPPTKDPAPLLAPGETLDDMAIGF